MTKGVEETETCLLYSKFAEVAVSSEEFYF